MGRLIITNDVKYADFLRKAYDKYGFAGNGEITLGGCLVSTFEKLNTKSYNLYTYGDNNYVACVGTLIYKDCFGENALKEIANDISVHNYDVEMIRSCCIGSYVLSYKNNNSIVVFVDEIGSFALHYCIDSDVFVITNTSFHVEQCVKHPLDVMALCERAVEFGIVDGASYYEGVYRLQGDEILEYCLNDCSIKRRRLKRRSYKLSESGFDDVVDEYASLLMNFFSKSKLISSFNTGVKIEQFATGGVDTRLFLGLFLANGVSPMVSNWIGHPYLIDSTPQDRLVSRDLAIKFGLEYKEYNLKCRIDDNKSFRFINYEKFGENGTIYGGSKGYYDIFSDKYKNAGYYEFGYFSEILRGNSVIEKLDYCQISLKNFVKSLLSRTGFANNCGLTDFYSRVFDYIYNKYKEIALDDGMDIECLSRTDCKRLSMYYRFKADGVSCSFANTMGYAPAFIIQKQLCDLAAQIPYDYVKNDRFVLALIKKIMPDLLDIPFFTHCQFARYYKNSNILTNNASIKSERFVDWYNKKILHLGIERIKKKVLKSELVKRYPELKIIGHLGSTYYMHMKEVFSVIECVEYNLRRNGLL